MHGIDCIQSGCIIPRCMDYLTFNHNAWNPLRSIGMLWAILHKIHCIQFAAWNPLHSIMLHKIHCIQSGCIGLRCMDSTAYNRDPSRQNAWNTLHSLTLHGLHCIPSGCFGPCCIKSTAFNHAAWNPFHSIMLYKIQCIQ